MKLNKKKIVIIISILVITMLSGISIYFLKINDSVYKYSKQTISILEKYKNGKITQENACNEIKNIYNVILELAIEESPDAVVSSTELGRLLLSIDEYATDISKNGKANIDKHIEELEKY